MKIKEVLSKNKYYRLEVGKDGKVLGGLFRYANTLMKQIDKMDPDYEDTYGDDVMDSIDKLDFDLKVPDVNWNGEDKEVVRCAFTQETFNKHRDTIDTLQTALEHFGYQLIKKEVQPDEDAIIYEDNDQIVYWDDMANVKPFLESFANHLDKDILEVIKDNRTTTNYVKQGKCSKTSGFNLLKAYKDPNTKDIKLYVGHLKPSNVDEEYTHIIAHMWIEVDGTTYATNEPKGFDRVIADTLTIDKDNDLYSQVENFLSKPSLNESLTESNNYGYHAGDLGKSEYYGSQSSSRGTGHFGTGTYFVGDPNRIKGYNDYNYGKGEAPHHIVDFSSYNLYKPSTNQKGYDLHDALKVLDGSYTYWKDKVDDVNTVKKYEGREKRRYDKFTEQELEELIGALNRLDSDEPLNYEYISNFLVPENFDKYYEELILADLDTDGAFDDQYEVQEQLYDKVQEWTDWRVLNAVRNVSNIENKLYQALEGRVSMSRIKQGLEDVVKIEKQYEANRDKKVDSLATVFMKSLGYEGIDTRHLNQDDKEQALAGLDNTSYGSVIYDVKPETIVESFEGKTFSLPKELVDKCIDYYKETYPTIKVDKLSIEQLVKDNDLLNDEDLQSYHQRQWDNKSAKEFSINQDKINNMRVSEVPFVVKKKDKLELVDGRHRIRALYNDGYNYVELPVVEESLTEGLTSEVDSEGNPLTKEQVEFFRNSKVRDTDGTLLLVYHGSKSSFNTFDKSKIKPWGWYGNGFYFTPSPNIASTYSEGYTLTCYLNITNPFYADSSFTNKEEYYKRCDKLYELVGITKEEVDKQDEECSYTSDPYYKLLMYLQHTKATRDINDYVKELGYDGVIGLDTEGEYQEIVAFEPNQIKAITNKAPSNSDNINEDLEQLHNYIEDNYGTSNLPKASSYILENGKYVDILGKGLEYHGDLDDELVSTFPEDEDIMNYVDEDGFIPMNLVKKLFPNIIKMNNGSRDVDSMFIELSDNVPTEEQLNSLIRWSLKLPKDNIVIYNHKNNIQAYVPTNKITKDYIKSLYGVKEDLTVKIKEAIQFDKDELGRDIFYKYAFDGNEVKVSPYRTNPRGNYDNRTWNDDSRLTPNEQKEYLQWLVKVDQNKIDTLLHQRRQQFDNQIDALQLEMNNAEKALAKYGSAVDESLTEGKQDIENFRKWIENNEDSLAPYMSEGSRKAFVNRWVDTFNEERKNLKAPFNDYYYWIKQNDWNAFTKMIADQGEKKASKQREKEGAKLIYSDDNWKVYEITTYEASKKYGANTKWCISGSKRWTNGGNGMRFWDDYTKEGVKFYFFINKDTKYALALYPDHKTFEIFDAQDNAISFIPNAPVVKEIKVDYFTRDDNRLLLNYIKTGQLPRVCDLLSNYMLEKDDIDVEIFSKYNFEDFLNTVRGYVNPDWVRWMAVDEGVLTKEQYEKETGDEYREDYWGGDTTLYLEDDLSFYDGYATLDDALTKDNPAFDYDNTEYFISDLYNNRLKLCKDWVAVWMYISEYVDDNELLEFTREWARENNMVDEYEELGLSRKYLLDESLQENLREDKDVVEFLYHGSPSPTLNLERDSTLWLAEDYGYAIGFGPYLHIGSAYIPNILEVGDTDGYIRGLIPTQFSPKFTEIANKLNMQPKELLRACGEDCKNIYSLVRTKQFRKICMEKGYDAVETEEFGNICYGVFNRHNVELIDTEDKEDEPTPMNESIFDSDNCHQEVTEELLTEGTKYDKQASKIISNSGLFNEETSDKIIQGLFKNDIHAFVHSPAWLEKYLKGIARMLVEYCDGDRTKAQDFLRDCPQIFDYYLTWVKENREKIGTELDTEFLEKMSYEDVKNKVNELQDKLNQQSKDELSKMKFENTSNYTLVPIDSYEQMHELYGGHWTGDGTDEEGQFAGGGGTSWCHTNNEGTYNGWTRNGSKFFVLQANNWKDIPFNKETNEEKHGKDAYGNSLIALLIDPYGRLKASTLRCNHLGIMGNADHQYETYADLSKVVGFNVDDELAKYDWDKLTETNGLIIEGSTVTEVVDKNIEEVTIPSHITLINDKAFRGCSKLKKVIFNEGLEEIGIDAFLDCDSLEEIVLPSSLFILGPGCFTRCTSLTKVTIKEGELEVIHSSAFALCENLTEVNLPSTLHYIEGSAFEDCISLRSIHLPKSITHIGYRAFCGCTNLANVNLNEINDVFLDTASFRDCEALTEVTLGKGVALGNYVFKGCTHLNKVTIPHNLLNFGNDMFKGSPCTVYTNDEEIITLCEHEDVPCEPLNKA